MASLHVELIVGVAFGVLFGTASAVLGGLLGSLSGYLGHRSAHRVLAVALALPVAVGLAYAAGVVQPTADEALRLLAAAVVALFLAAYGFSRGAALVDSFPRKRSRSVQRGRSLSASALDAVDASGQVTIRPSDDVRAVEGYPAPSAELRERIADLRWQLPADLPLSELEERIERRLQTAFDLAAVSVSVDPRGRATVAAAPTVSGLARRVPDGYRAVSVATNVPEGTAPGDEVVVEAGSHATEGVVLSVTPADGARDAASADAAGADATGAAGSDAAASADPAGLGRVAVAVPSGEADPLLSADLATVAVRSRDTRTDFRTFSLLDQAGEAVRVTRLDERTLSSLRSGADGPAVFAACPPGDDGERDWRFDVDAADVAAGWEAFLVGDRSALDGLLDGRDAAVPEVVGA